MAAAVAVLALVGVGGLVAWHGDSSGPTMSPSPSGTVTPQGPVVVAPPRVAPGIDPEAWALEGSDGGPWTLAGEVRDAKDLPVPGAVVQLFAARGMPFAGARCDACGRPVTWCEAPVNTRAVLARIREGAATPVPLATATADAQGRFELAGLPPEAVALWAQSGALQGTDVLEEIPPPGERHLVHVAPVRQHSVRVLDARDKPVAGVSVTVLSLQTGEVQVVSTDRDGRLSYRLAGEEVWAGVDAPGWLPTGQVVAPEGKLVLRRPRALLVRTRVAGKPVDAEVHVDEHGERTAKTSGGEVRFDDLHGDAVTLWATTAELSSESPMVWLEDGVVRELTLELRRTASLDVVVVDGDGRPIEEPWVEVVAGGAVAGVSPEVVEGRAHFADLPEGAYTLNVRATGFHDVARELDLVPGVHEERVVLAKKPTIRGHVVDEAGNPVSDAEVWVQDDDRDADSTTTDQDGRFELELRMPGVVPLVAWSTTHGRGTATGRSGEPVVVTLRRGAVLELELRDVDGTPISESVRLRGVDNGENQWAQVEVPLSRIAGLEPGRWELSVTREKRLAITKELTLQRDEVVRLRLQLEAGATVDGRVVEAGGVPIAAAQVTIDGSIVDTSDERGHFALLGVPAGPVTVTAFDQESSRNASADVVAPARDVLIRFAPTWRVTGRVVDEQGRPVPSFTVERQVVAQADGRFDVQVEAGNVRIAADGYRTARFEVQGDTDLGVVRLSRVGVLRGEVVAQGRPVPGATVLVVSTYEEAVSDAAGRFEVPLDEWADWPIEVLAFRGGLSGKTSAVEGQPVRVELAAGTHVVGRLVDDRGQGVEADVTFELAGEVSRRVTASSDAAGRFEIDLLPGQWIATPRAGARYWFSISGARQELSLVISRSCMLSVELPDVDAAWLVPAGASSAGAQWDTGTGVPPGTVIPPLGEGLASIGMACGRYELVTVRDDQVARVPVELTSGRTVVRLPAAPPPAE
ncbi:MAG: carboxypeptidase-like regulatory domain-containing protein [Myxococcota bacterium]